MKQSIYYYTLFKHYKYIGATRYWQIVLTWNITKLQSFTNTILYIIKPGTQVMFS